MRHILRRDLSTLMLGSVALKMALLQNLSPTQPELPPPP
ncbi:hypothetical protein M595_1264 [Lyngbya aestuarii BL J]|uniref:Uncharacterized protein n=1 Tax=Lyngbya aestuarii BL J TaxID=1348334 RepID=U7QNM7_9CYAN|nr:hypothetical protein M595_1264 [Lyngbya aestuarii BL J]